MKSASGFSLLQLMAVVAIMAAIAAVVLPGVSRRYRAGLLTAEDAALSALRTDILATFEEPDLALNLAVCADDTTQSLLNYSADFTDSGTPTNWSAATLWYMRVYAARGRYTGSFAANPSAIAAVREIYKNHHGRNRLYLWGPSEARQQRYLLVSLCARSDQLAFPTNYTSAAFFDAIWTTDWNNTGAALPAGFTAGLTPAQSAAWSGQQNLLRVVRFTAVKHTVNVGNSHPTDKVWLTWGEKTLTGTGVLAPIVCPDAAGQRALKLDVLDGRTVTVWRGTTLASAAFDRTILVHRDENVLCQ